MSKFVKFPKIRSFDYICEKTREQSGSSPVTTYGAKVKLNGRNVAVRISSEGNISAQEKYKNISLEDDKFGFCKWLQENMGSWKIAHENCSEWKNKDVILFGEWAGEKVERDPPDAVTMLEKTFFFVFGLLVDEMYFSDPPVISKLVPSIPSVRVIPWFIEPKTDTTSVHFSKEESTQHFANYISDVVESMEQEDPYIKSEFGISGPAEGLVLTPVVEGRGVTIEEFSEFTFKAKVKRHWVHRSTRPAVTRVTVPENASQFIEKFVTHRRCGQGISEACDGIVSAEKVDAFVSWMEQDVKKESEYEREKMAAQWKLLSRHVTIAATKWFYEACSHTD